MVIELINTGSELMLGRVLNSHQQWICRTLADHGYTVTRQVAVPDGADDIERSVVEALGRADLVITTGGLGPTCDDITRERIAGLLGVPLDHDPAVERQIHSFFTSRNRPIPSRTKVEALVPPGGLVLPNSQGTAPGLVLRHGPNKYRTGGTPSWIVMLPGPPRELHPMFRESVIPWLQKTYPLNTPFVNRTLKTTGLGESLLEERLTGPLDSLVRQGMDLGFCARVGEVEVRFVARHPEAAEMVAEAERITRQQIGEYIYGSGDETLETALVKALTDRRRTLALAESCTGGHIANRITNVPGASAVLVAGLVTYANSAKQRYLGVSPAVLEAHGAVSEPVAIQMAEGARTTSGADFAIAVTGIAGPTGGTEQKPVGTVFIAIASPDGTKCWKELNRFDRETFKYTTAQQAMVRLLRLVLNSEAPHA
ncbi:MAG TPA: competence/damage-inducible protein A [Candidatus Limnocylindria bacterium]|nr:competence/damage-inducible protein A [Candidatus Limnocylindria bacterium]